jgi:hypothetical protein
MIKFDKPAQLDGITLTAELQKVGVILTQPPYVDGNNDLWLDIKEKDIEKTNKIVVSHKGETTIIQLTVEEKMSKVGLNLDELKTALGL